MTDDLGRGHRRGLYWVAAMGAALLAGIAIAAALHGKREDPARRVQLLLNQAACSSQTPGTNGVPKAAGVWWGRNVPAVTLEQLRAFDSLAKEAPSLGDRIAITGGGHAGVCTRFDELQARAFTAFRTLYR
ncbi:MAG TPA: hypothetical protein VFW85_01670 [Gaiellaceae bacterium]|nr:hypothetical protein [Gaiellaceae bacterium]